MELVAHRGCAMPGPENTLRAIRNAGSRLPAVEFDVRRCATGELVVFHDEDVGRLTDGTGLVSELPWEELRKLDILGSGEHVPQLTDVLSAVPTDTVAQIELKETDITADIVDIVTEREIDVRISSFDERALAEMAQSSLDVPLGYLFKEDPYPNLNRAADLGCTYIHPHVDLCLNTDIVSTAHQRGFEVLAWNTDNSDVVEQLREANVDGVTVDRVAI